MGEIVLKDINKNYGGEQLFNNLNLRFEVGKITAVMGPSGLGKTTLLRILLGLEDFEGSIVGMDGMRIGVMFQDNLLMPWLTLRENIELIAGISAATDEALKLTELEDAADKKPAELSGGMQRRAALARTFAAGGDLLILDEPFTGLDEELRERVASRLCVRWKREGTTVILVTHDSEEAKNYGDDIIRLSEV